MLINQRRRKMTKREFDKVCRGCREDFEADANTDGSEMTIQDVAYDMADSMMYDKEMMDYLKKAYPGVDKQTLKEILADNLCG
jgi:hypothetical protein